jgi:hypothetical protein
MKNWIAALFLVSLTISPSAWAQPAIAPPHLGFVEDSTRALRPAYGLAGNFILGPAIAGKIVTEAFSGSFGLLKTDSSLAAFDATGKLLASMDVAPGPAIFAFSPGGATALAYIASSNALVEWRGSAFAPVSLKGAVISDAVLAIAFPTPFEASLIVQRNDTVWQLNLPLGTVGTFSQNALIGIQAPVLALPSGDLVYRNTGGIAIRRTDASEVHIAAFLPASFSLQQMNRDWVQLTDLNGSRSFAIRTTPGREGFYQLPEVSQGMLSQ